MKVDFKGYNMTGFEIGDYVQITKYWVDSLGIITTITQEIQEDNTICEEIEVEITKTTSQLEKSFPFVRKGRKGYFTSTDLKKLTKQEYLALLL